MNKKFLPRLIFWELTKRCNLKCQHCRAEAEDKLFHDELTTQQVLSVIDNIAEHYSPIMVFTGGEPLYRNDIFDIAGYASGKGLRCALASNGTMIDEHYAQLIKESGITRVSISIDGKDARSHDTFRGIKGSFDKALEASAHLKLYDIDFQFNCTIARHNANDIEAILQLSEKQGAKALHIFMLVPVGCGVEIADREMISTEQYEKVLEWFYQRSKSTTLEFKATCAPHYYRIIRQQAAKEGRKISFEADGMNAMTRGCLAGTGVAFIGHNGTVQPCGYLPLSAGNVLGTSFNTIWETSDLFSGLRDFNSYTGKCGECEYIAVCGGCRARAYYSSGNFIDEEPYCQYLPKGRTYD